jgi:hypothetical protein
MKYLHLLRLLLNQLFDILPILKGTRIPDVIQDRVVQHDNKFNL